MLDAAAAWLQRHLLDAHPGLTLRVAVALGLTALERHIEREFLEVGIWWGLLVMYWC